MNSFSKPLLLAAVLGLAGSVNLAGGVKTGLTGIFGQHAGGGVQNEEGVLGLAQ